MNDFFETKVKEATKEAKKGKYNFLLVQIEDVFVEYEKLGENEDPNPFYQEIADLALKIYDKKIREDELKRLCKKYFGAVADYKELIVPRMEVKDEDIVCPIKFDEKNFKIIFFNGSNRSLIAEDFLIYLRYRLEDEDENVRWILDIKTKYSSTTLEITNKEFNSAKDMRTLLLAKRFSFDINDSKLNQMHNLLLKQSPKDAKKVVRYGYDRTVDAYVFSNKVVWQNKLYESDENGIVALGKMSLSMMTSDKERQNNYWFKYSDVNKTTLNFSQWIHHLNGAYNADIALQVSAHYLFSIFRDIIVDELAVSPILYLKGPASSGKSSIARLYMTLFGVNSRDGNINLKGKVTPTAMMRKMAQYSNTAIWADEYQPNMKNKDVEGVFQAAYDNSGLIKSKSKDGRFDTGNETETTEIRSSIVITTNYFADEAPFFSRCIYIPVIQQGNRTQAQIDHFDAISQYEESGLSHITAHFQQYRPLVKHNFKAEYFKIRATLKKRLANFQNVPDRLIINQAAIIAPFLIISTADKLISGGNYEVEKNIMVNIAVNQIKTQMNVMNDSSSLRIFWEIAQDMYNKKMLTNKVEYKFKWNKGSNEEELVLRFGLVWGSFKRHYQMTYHQPAPDKKTMEDEIAKFLGVESDKIYTQDTFLSNEAARVPEDAPITSIPLKMTGRKDAIRFPYNQLIDEFNVDFDLFTNSK